MRMILIPVFLTLFHISFGQKITLQLANQQLSTIFKETRQKPEVLLLGTYHFSDPDADEYKTADSLQVDILSVIKQNELKEVMNALLKFRPTKIAIEAKTTDQNTYDSLYQLYLKGQLQQERDEKFQIAVRLAKMLGHRKLYGIDAQPFVKTLYETDSIADQKYSDENDATVTAIEDMYDEFYSYDDTLQRKMKLMDYLRLINSVPFLKYDNGQYLYHTRKGRMKNLSAPMVLY